MICVHLFAICTTNSSCILIRTVQFVCAFSVCHSLSIHLSLPQSLSLSLPPFLSPSLSLSLSPSLSLLFSLPLPPFLSLSLSLSLSIYLYIYPSPSLSLSLSISPSLPLTHTLQGTSDPSYQCPILGQGLQHSGLRASHHPPPGHCQGREPHPQRLARRQAGGRLGDALSWTRTQLQLDNLLDSFSQEFCSGHI